MKLKPILAGAKSYICGFDAAKNPAATVSSARYSYSVWLRHLVLANRFGLSPAPEVVAELGPGDSLGVGLAALLSGSVKYYALDVVDYASAAANLRILDELVELFEQRSAIPGPEDFPLLHPLLPCYCFPATILPDTRLRECLRPERVATIREALTILGRPEAKAACGIEIRYYVPWDDPGILQRGTADLIYSQAVLEHVDNLENTYRAMHTWLKPGGFLSHQIDFQCHGTAEQWNGHWGYSDFTWNIIRGRRPYLLNRCSQSDHIRSLERTGFQLLHSLAVTAGGGIERRQLAPCFRRLSDEDLQTSGAYLLAKKN